MGRGIGQISFYNGFDHGHLLGEDYARPFGIIFTCVYMKIMKWSVVMSEGWGSSLLQLAGRSVSTCLRSLLLNGGENFQCLRSDIKSSV